MKNKILSFVRNIFWWTVEWFWFVVLTMLVGVGVAAVVKAVVIQAGWV